MRSNAARIIPLNAPALSQLVADAKSWETTLLTEGKSAHTIDNYLRTVEAFDAFLASLGMPRDTATVSKRDVQAYILHETTVNSSGTAATRFGNLRAFFNWAVREEIIDASPMVGLRMPSRQERPPAVLTEDQLTRMLKACDGKRFQDRRDMALVRLLLATGARRAEVAGLRIEDVDIVGKRVQVIGKGNRVRVVPFGDKTAQALDRYVRVRRTHKHAGSKQFFLTQMSTPFTGASVAAIVGERARQAGIGHVHPHQLRHTFAHLSKMAGLPDEVIEQVAGWRPGSTMLRRYGASAAHEYALQTYRDRQGDPGDRL